MAVNGNTIVLYADVSGTATAVGAQRGVSFNRSAEMLDVSDKSDADGKFIAGKRTDTVSLSSFYVESDAAYRALRTAWEGGTAITATWYEDQTDDATDNPTSFKSCTGALVTSISIDAPANGPAECEIQLQISGGWS